MARNYEMENISKKIKAIVKSCESLLGENSVKGLNTRCMKKQIYIEMKAWFGSS